ncbi:MAG: AAA family ATPase, partial [Candidatus Omnitrophica bacterium]|nr:AAA family ATPase [Candidatus Omnitrophota bacterium]
MLARSITARFVKTKKSILLLGPRQVGKSTLIRSLKPDRLINLMDESLYLGYAKDPARLKRELSTIHGSAVIAIDEIQRVPALLNIVQLLLDEELKLRFFLTGSSARKLKRGQANLLPGRILVEHLDPLSYWELEGKLNLEKVLQIGSLPGIYLEDAETGAALLSSYGQTYLREEIQAEALIRNLGPYARFLDAAAEASGQWINYSKMSSDSEIPKETLRRFYSLLEDTLIVFRIPPWRTTVSKRRVSQRERFVFFDLGVRNALLGIHKSPLSSIEKGRLFEQWILLQIIAFIHAYQKEWHISSFRTDTGIEVDWVLETPSSVIGLECKWGKQVSHHDFNGLRTFEKFSRKPLRKIVIYTGTSDQQFA